MDHDDKGRRHSGIIAGVGVLLLLAFVLIMSAWQDEARSTHVNDTNVTTVNGR